MLKVGSKGEEVKAWQKFLRRKGFYNCGASGRFGVGVAKATKAWQEQAGVFGDGIVGPITLAAAKADGFKAPSKKEEATDAGIPSAVLEAFRKVESNGKADAVRFEPHIFVRLRPDLAAQIPYTSNRFIWSTVASETDRAAFDHAASLDAEAAIKATSWGLFQVMGVHLLGLFGQDTGAALEAFDDDPEGISDRLVAQWFAANPRARRAANKTPIDWHDLARCYNGSQYAKHGYHTKLRKAWAAIVGR